VFHCRPLWLFSKHFYRPGVLYQWGRVAFTGLPELLLRVIKFWQRQESVLFDFVVSLEPFCILVHQVDMYSDKLNLLHVCVCVCVLLLDK
jgi:hypothetical protein